jgi:hypothetical protein
MIARVKERPLLPETRVGILPKADAMGKRKLFEILRESGELFTFVAQFFHRRNPSCVWGFNGNFRSKMMIVSCGARKSHTMACGNSEENFLVRNISCAAPRNAEAIA